MVSLERLIFQRISEKHLVWFRYLDDIFCIWTAGEDNLKLFFAELNTLHEIHNGLFNGKHKLCGC